MRISNLIAEIEKLSGNLLRGNGCYISSQNMSILAEQLNNTGGNQSILLTPYLIIENGAIYELYYYEFDIEVGNEESHLSDYNSNNSLPKEVTDNLKPKANISFGDIDFYQKSVKWYLNSMKEMTFNEVKNKYPELKNAKLFYQIFTDREQK